jgi:hypothetical protein
MGIPPLFPQSDDTDALVPESLLARLIAWNDYFQRELRCGHGLAISKLRLVGLGSPSRWRLK